MASRLMHLAVANKVAKSFEIDRDPFVFGNLITDAHSTDKADKWRSHFIDESSKLSESHFIKYHQFRDKYLKDNPTAVHFGYYSHLITDDVWLRTIYKNQFLNNHLYEPSTKRQLYYENYGYLNQWMKSAYQLTWCHKAYPAAIDEIDNTLISNVMLGLEEDFKAKSSPKNIVFFCEETIEVFINEASQLVLREMKAL